MKYVSDFNLRRVLNVMYQYIAMRGRPDGLPRVLHVNVASCGSVGDAVSVMPILPVVSPLGSTAGAADSVLTEITPIT